ncbi:cytochrome P450 [Nocardioides sp. NBC_00850]|uniref:cytochrome P450 n=1 Tax=Nocardioides sp. NBC_00850 TaxID=2976001 RepID=UPI00386D3FC2|nr:cytochrome P450 [Nocardioides sp. NBC_00850]
MTSQTLKPEYDEIELSSETFWSRTVRDRDVSFAALREQRPLSWQPPAYGTLMDDPDDEGYWAAVRHEEVTLVSKDDMTFSSAPDLGGVMFENVPEQILRDTQSILTMDEPEHGRTRALVASAFNPRQIRRIGEQIQSQAVAIVDDLLETGPGDFVEKVAKRLPLWTISEMVGVPVEERERMVVAVDDMVGHNDPEYIGDRDPFMCLLGGMGELHDIAQNLIDARRSAPQDDLMSALVQAEIDGTRLDDEELRSYFVLLAIAGSDTTRNTTSHAVKALTDFPEQKALLLSDFDRMIPSAIEEFIRWATPVMTFRRTATRDVELAGQQVLAGDKVVMFYGSANRDARVFENPWEFDISRSPNPHVGLGGGGVHYCLGQHVTRMQMRHLFRELLTRVPTLTVGEPEFVVGHFMNAIKRMPIDF